MERKGTMNFNYSDSGAEPSSSSKKMHSSSLKKSYKKPSAIDDIIMGLRDDIDKEIWPKKITKAQIGNEENEKPNEVAPDKKL